MSISWTGPQFISEAHQPTRRVRCPVHGFIRYSQAEQRIIDHPVFQRLRYIRQLAFTYYVYPGATHTRFEHSLGVMELATRAFDVLCQRQADLLSDHLKSLPELSIDTLARARQVVRLLGLLHDVGHTAFSHAGESILPGRHHEALSAWIVSRAGPLGLLLEKEFFEGIAPLLESMLRDDNDGNHTAPPQILVLTRLIAGQLDLDRTDYLLRDSLYCGVEYGRFDHQRLIGSLVLHENADTQSLAVGIDRGGYHTFEGLLLARYYMNTQVYFHRVRRACDLLLRRWLEAWGEHHYQPLERAIDYDDLALIAQMRKDVACQDETERQRWARRLLHRDLPKLVYERGDHADARDLQTAMRIHQTLTSEFPESEFLLDDNARGPIHKLYVPGDQEFIDDLFIVDRLGAQQSFSSLSKIVEKIPKQFWAIRIFGYSPDNKRRDAAKHRAEQLASSG